MKTAVVSALIILGAGIAAGAVANQFFYDPPLKWIRERKPIEKSAHISTSQSTTTSPAATAAQPGPCDPQPGDKPHTVRMECVLQYMEKGGAYIIDAREQHDFDEGHLRGSIHLPSSAIYANIERVMASGAQVTDTVIVYCGGGDCEASHNVADALRNDFQFNNVLIYEKGWQEIESSGKFGGLVEKGTQE